MPTSSALNTARDTLLTNLQALNQTNPLSPATAQLALLSLIADNAGGGGGGSAGTQYGEGVATTPATGTVLLFRRTDGTLKALQGDNSDRIKVVGEVTLATGSSIAVSNFPTTQAISGSLTIQDGTTTVNKLSVASDGSIPTRRIDADPITEAALTAAGSTTARSVSGYRYYSYQIQITGIGTNVVLRMEGTHLASPATAADWYSLQGNNVDTTIAANGSYKFQIAGETDLQVRMTLASFSGGTPSVVCTLIRGN